MKLINKKDNQISFTAELGETLANAIRRYLNQVLVLAVDEVEISKNNSPLYDETVAHRIGLIPLKSEGSVNEKTTDTLKLDAKKEGMIYSSELKGKVNVVYDKIPITSLNKGQELKINAIVKAGRGSEHSKFSPGLMFYRNIFDVKIDKDCPAEVVEVCPQKILALKDGKVTITDSSKCDMCEACLEICKKYNKDSIKITPGKELFISMESFGQMDVKNMFKKSIEALKKDLNEISKGLK